MFERFAEVALRLPLSQLYSYRVPPELHEQVAPGKRVAVEFSGREEEAMIVAVHGNPPDRETLPLQAVLDAAPVLTEYQLRLGAWMADYYMAGPGECYFKMFPGSRPVRPRDLPPGFGARADSAARANAAAGSESSSHDGSPARTAVVGAPAHELNEEQAQAFAAARADLERPAGERPPVHLLHGVTGSGKTEVYIHLILAALEAGRGALLLVPEISLTVQLIERLERVFGDELALLHSALGGRERFGAYLDLLFGKRRIAVGTRSAVFAPVRNPGLILLDEEHDSSYKEHSAPRYDARQVAHRRAQDEGAVLVLGSATPRVESAYFARALSGASGFRYHRLGLRATGAALPKVNIVEHSVSDIPISGAVLNAVDQNLKRGEQTLLLLNRRGYHPFVYCEACKQTERCPNCSVALNLHRDARLVCHYCGHSRAFSGLCSTCGGRTRKLGSGTQKLEEYLLGLFPEARLERLDTDAARRKNVVRGTIGKLLNNELDILLGTQMIAKGLDAPGVTLVSVLQADHGLAMPDFRAAERSFSLLTQVAGRAGRGKLAGRVFFECLNPEQPIVLQAARQDYESFYREEILNRRDADYPPFCRLIRLLYRGDDEARVDEAIERLARALRSRQSDSNTPFRLLGPAPAPLERLQNHFRRHLILKTNAMKATRGIVAELASEERRRAHKSLYLEIDVDPADLL